MGKLGKKARKFAKKGLHTVLKRQRKLKSFYKKRDSKKNKLEDAEVVEEDAAELSNDRETEDQSLSLDALFDEDDSDMGGKDSDSDGYIPEPEDSGVSYKAEIGSENGLEDNDDGSALSTQNKEIQRELAENLEKIETLKKKDPKFREYLEGNNNKVQEPQRNGDLYSDEDETSDDDGAPILYADSSNTYEGKLLTPSSVASWCQLVKDQQNVTALTCLLNGFRAACHSGDEGILADNSRPRFQSSETYSEVLMFTLSEADNIFKQLLGINSPKCKKEMILELKNTTRWKNLRPLIKLYLRSTLFLLNQASDTEILAYALTRIRPSIAFFAVFPSLLYRLIKIAVHLWATGEGTLSLYSFHIIQDVTSASSSKCLNTCFVKMYKVFMDNCKSMEPAQLKHIQFLRDSIVELCSMDLQQSSNKAVVSIQLLGKILQQGIQTKQKEAVKKICSWQYINCIDLWVAFISANISDYDLQTLLVTTTKIINGMAQLFTGPRYLPLRLKCIGWLNHLSGSSGVFIPVISLVLEILEYAGKEGGKHGKAFNLSSAIKVPKYWLKSRKFYEECVLSAIELLSMHFSQWSYHISFPDLATIPLIHLKKFHETTSIENFRRVVKRFIDQVEQNVEFIKKKRDEVAFSPKDLQSVETFLQLEKCGGNVPFMQYYKSVIGRAATRHLIKHEKLSSSGQKESKRKRQVPSDNKVDGVVPGEGLKKNEVNSSVGNGKDEKKAKKRRS